MDGGGWRATVHGVTKSQTQLRNFHFLSRFEYPDPCLCAPCAKNQYPPHPHLYILSLHLASRSAPLPRPQTLGPAPTSIPSTSMLKPQLSQKSLALTSMR